MNAAEESPYRLRVAGGDSVPVSVEVDRDEPVEMPGRFVNRVPGMTRILLRAARPMPQFAGTSFAFGQKTEPMPAQVAMFHDDVDGGEHLGGVVGGRVTLIGWTRSAGLVFSWIPDDEMNALPW